VVKLPRGEQEAVQRIARAERELEDALGRSPTTAAIADALEVSIEEVLDARMAALARITDSLDEVRGDGGPGGVRRIDVHQVEEAGFAAAEDTATLACLLPYVDAREREVLRLRFEEDLTQKEIADRIGCSQMHVSRLIRGAIARLAAVDAARADACAGPRVRRCVRTAADLPVRPA